MVTDANEDPARTTSFPARPAGTHARRVILTESAVPGDNRPAPMAATVVPAPVGVPAAPAAAAGTTAWLPARVAPAGRSKPALLVLATVLTLGLLLLAAWLAFGAGRSAAACTVCGAVQEFPSQGNTHIRPGESHPAYNSDPPTSGWHREEFPPGGPDQFFYDPPLDDEVTVHLMEHLMIIAWYHCPVGMDCTPIREALVRTAQTVPRDAAYRIYVTARPSLPGNAVIALGAWSHLQYLAGFDQAQVDAFVKQFGGHMAVTPATPPPK